MESPKRITYQPSLPNREQPKSKTEQLRQLIQEANGEPILLAKTINGKRLYLTVVNDGFDPRPGEIDHSTSTTRSMDPEYTLDYDRSINVPPVTGISFISLFIEDEPAHLKPIGRYFWFIRGEVAHGGPGPFQQSDIPQPNLSPLALQLFNESLTWWNNSMVTNKVDNEYAKQGLGSFMFSVAMINLDLLGFKKFRTGGITEAAQALWKKFWRFDHKWDFDLEKRRFGIIKKGDASKAVHPYAGNTTVQDVTQKPLIEHTLRQFM